MVSCYRIFAVTSFVLKVRSWSGNNVPIYLYQMNVVFYHSCPVKRGQSLKAELSPWNVPSWISRNRSHLAAPSGQGSHNLPTSHPWWSQAPNPKGPVSSGCPSEETSSQRLRPRKMATDCRLQRQGWGRGSPLLKAWVKATGGPSWGLWSTTGCHPQSIPWDLNLTHWPKAGWCPGPPKECLNLHLLSISCWCTPQDPSLITSPILPSWK